MAEVQFVAKEAFDIQIKAIRDREDADERISDIRFDYMREMMDSQFERLEAVVEKNLAKHEAIAESIRNDMKSINERMDRMEKNVAYHGEAINRLEGDVKAISARLDTQQTKFGWYLTAFGIVITVVVAAIQFFLK
ncbi:MAG: hypothetical protein IJU98_12275 [Synergistaceae bacterium]|nr:hypothetical protein [Synergistaceae bacterium]